MTRLGELLGKGLLEVWREAPDGSWSTLTEESEVTLEAAAEAARGAVGVWMPDEGEPVVLGHGELLARFHEAAGDDMTNWRYGDAGDRIPVAFGQTWGVGEHLFRCDDLEAPAHESGYLVGLPAFDMVYSDPPWDAGNARAFRTKAGKGRAVDFEAFVGRLADVFRRARGDVWCEMGNRLHEQQIALLKRAGAHVCDVWECVYYGGPRTCRIVRLRWRAKGEARAGPHPPAPWMGNMSGEAVTRYALSLYPAGQTVLDPCCGMGMTAKYCLEHGHRFVGVELNPRRLANAIDLVAKATGIEAELVGEAE